MDTFTIGDKDFLLNSAPFRILSGAIHYFRVHPDLWADRIHKARLMGLNTIETYVPWNEHSPTPDSFITDCRLDLGRFLDLVAAEGMRAIVRPGPYICAEWDNGGLPAWLFTDPTIGVRSSEPGYLAAVDGFMDHLLPIVVERQITRGGPVILLQIENEYGAYNNDKAYLQHLVDVAKRAGVDVPLFTCDQPFGTMIEDGSLPGLHKTGTFGSRTDERLAFLRQHQPTGPLMCAEFWNGWFDNWGTSHHTTGATAAAEELDALLTAGASVNIYMFHGGTNFGFSNGANDKGIYQPTTTSYDYDAPLSEDGYPTDKYFAFRDVIAKHFPVPEEMPSGPTAAPESVVQMTSGVPLLDVVAAFPDRLAVAGAVPASEVTGQYRGYFLYERQLPNGGVLAFHEIRDRAQFFLDGCPIGTLNREFGERAITVPGGGLLQVLVEDQGRVNYGPRIGEAKGLIGPALLNGQEIPNWTILAVDVDSLEAFRSASTELSSQGSISGPSISFASFTALGPDDRYLSLDGWTKGNAFINGFNIGRYWSRGPQRTLYVPGPLIRKGTNNIAILELQGSSTRHVQFVAGPNLGPEDG